MADRIVEIAASGGDYTSFSLAVAGEDDFQAGEDDIIFRRTDAVRETGYFSVTGYTTSAAHRVIIEAADSAMHDKTRGSGAGVCIDDYYFAINIDVSYVTIRKLEISNTNNTGIYIGNGRNNAIIDRCLVYDCASYGINSNYSDNTVIANTAILDTTSSAIVVSHNTNGYYYNLTILNAGAYGVFFEGYGTTHLKNCYIGGSGTADLSIERNISLTTTATSDGSHSTPEIEIADCDFVSSTAGSEDIEIGSASDLFGEGTDLSEDAVYPITIDILGTARASTPCMGAFEYVSSGATAKSISDSGTGSDAIRVVVDFTLADSGTSAESILVKQKISIADTSSGADSDTVKAYIKQADTGITNDGAPIIKAVFSLTDTGTVADDTRVFVKSIVTESGNYADAINSIKAYLRLDDSGLGADDLAIIAKLALGETATGADLATKGGNAYVALADSGVGVDSISIRALLGISDSGTGAEGDFEKCTLVLSDSGVSVDNVSIKALLALLDSGISSDDISYNNPAKALSDTGTFVDTVIVVGNGGAVEDIYFSSPIVKTVSYSSPIQKTLNYKTPITKTLNYTAVLQ